MRTVEARQREQLTALHALPLLDDAITAWLDPIADSLVALGAPTDDARVDARLMVAVTRGLLLDLLATGDRRGVDAAMRRMAALLLAPAP